MPNWKKVITSGSDAILNSLSVGDLGVTGSLNVAGSISGNTQDVSDYFIDYTGLDATKFQVGNVNNGTFIFANRFTGDILSYNGLSGVFSINASTRLLTGNLYVGTGTAATPTIRFNGRVEHRIYTPYNSSVAPLILSSTSGNIELDTPLTYLSGSLEVSGSLTADTFSGNGSSISNLNASNLSSGTIPDARFPSALPAIDGSALTGISAGGSIFAATGSVQATTNDLQITGSLQIYKSGSTVFSIEGSQGQLFSVTDELSGSLFSVNDISGIPILEVFSDDTVKIGTYSAEGIEVQGSDVKITGSLAVGNISPNATDGRIDASNDIVAYSSSDKRWKTNIKLIESPLEKLQKLSGVEFDWIEDFRAHGNSGNDIGVIAQEVELVLPQAVQTRDTGMKAVRYEKLIPLLIETIKEQQKQIDELKNKIG